MEGSNERLKNKGIGTIAIHAGQGKNPFGALSTPIYQTSHSYLTQQSKVEQDLQEKRRGIYTLDLEILQQQ